MKVLAFALAVCLTASQAQAQSAAATTAPAAADNAYTAAVTAALAAQNAAQTPAEIQASVAQFERIGAAAPTEWLPRYYQARGYLKLGFAGAGEADRQDQLFDQAQAALDAARQLPGADQAEVLALQAYIYQGRIMVAPMTRGMVYTGRVHEALAQAQKLSPNNPRVYLMQANDVYYRPAVFGGGPAAAKPLYEKAQALFATFRPATPLSPNWGQGNATASLKKIDGQLAQAK